MDTKVPSGARIVYGEGIAPSGDVIFTSTDSQGTPGQLNVYVLQQLGLDASAMPDAKALRAGYALLRLGGQIVCFVVTLDELAPPAQALEHNLLRALQDPNLAVARSLWLPLMGTGTARLAPAFATKIIQTVIMKSGWGRKTGVEIVITGPPAAVSAYPPISPAVNAALRLGSTIRSGQVTPASRLSTRLLLFALSLSNHPQAPPGLVADEDARTFCAALELAAGERLTAAWESCFRSAFQYAGMAPEVELPGPSKNLAKIFAAADRFAKADERPILRVDDLITALLEASEGRHLELLDSVGVTPTALLKSYQVARSGRVALTLHNDVAADKDRLGYDSYATAIADFLTHAQTPPPLSVSIQAPWGVGKSSLMQMVRNHLDPQAVRDRYRPAPGVSLSRLRLGEVTRFLDQKIKIRDQPPLGGGRRWTVWFNAWKYETSEQVWAGLVNAIIDEVSERLPPTDRELFLLKLQLARIDDGVVRRKIHDRVANLWWNSARQWMAAGGSAIVGLLGIGVAAKSETLPVGLVEATKLSADALGALGINTAITLQLVLSAYLLARYFLVKDKVKREPAHFSLAEYLSIPDYSRALGSVHQIHADLLKVLSVVPKDGMKPTPLVVFIDDLDRCAPDNVAALVEGVSAILASNVPCIFVIGMDPQMVAAALEKAHAEVRSRLPSYERSVPLGWRFMDKFIQLPFTIPPSSAASLETYLNDLRHPQKLPELEAIAVTPQKEPDALVRNLTAPIDWLIRLAGRLERTADRLKAAAELIDLETASQPISAEQSAKAEIEAFKEGRDVGVILSEVQTFTAGNPRELKRLANMARFYLQLRNARREKDNAWTPPEPRQYARWIALTLRWPDMMRWLQWGADEQVWSEASSSLVVRRLVAFEDSTLSADSRTAWVETVKGALNLSLGEADAGHWLHDPKLYEFFRAEGARPESERLSNAVALEFW